MSYHLAIRAKIGDKMNVVLNSFTNDELNEIVKESEENPSKYWIAIWNRFLELQDSKTP